MVCRVCKLDHSHSSNPYLFHVNHFQLALLTSVKLSTTNIWLKSRPILSMHKTTDNLASYTDTDSYIMTSVLDTDGSDYTHLQTHTSFNLNNTFPPGAFCHDDTHRLTR